MQAWWTGQKCNLKALQYIQGLMENTLSLILYTSMYQPKNHHMQQSLNYPMWSSFV